MMTLQMTFPESIENAVIFIVFNNIAEATHYSLLLVLYS